jgi:putative ABC transport system permease protein
MAFGAGLVDMKLYSRILASTSQKGAVPSIMLLAYANIKRDVLRSALLVSTIALATLLFLTALGSLSGLQKPITQMMSKQNASHVILDFDSRIYSSSQLSSWWLKQDEVRSITPMLPFMTTSNRPLYNGKEMGDHLMLVERPSQLMQQDKLRFIDGIKRTAPESGELWLPSSVAFSAGIKVNENLEIPTEQGIKRFKVSAIVVDPQYSSGFIGPARAWISPGELVSVFPLGSINSYMFGAQLHDPETLPKVWSRFNQSFGGGFSGGYLSYDRIISSYAQTIQLMAALVLVFAVISLIVALFIIATTISGEILSSYCTFGILKSLGFTSKNVVQVFQLQFLFISMMAVPIGIFGAYFATDAMIGLMLKSIGASGDQVDFVIPALITFIVVVMTILLVVAFVGKKAGRIKPASAIRYGAPEDTVNNRLPFHLRLARFLPIVLVIALKNLSSGKKRELFDLIAISITAFVLFFSVNVYHSMSVMDKNLPFWGLDDSDIRILRDTSPLFGVSYEALSNRLKAQNSVQTVVGHINLNAVVPSSSEHAILDVDGYIVDGSFDAIGYQNVRGRNPVANNEMSIGIPLAEDYGIELGDPFSMVVNGQRITLTVVGIFQGTNNGGYFYRAPLSAMTKADPNLEPKTLLVKLKEKSQRQAFMDVLERQLGQAVSTELSEKLVESQLKQVVSGLGLVLGFISSILILVAGVSIYNSTAMGIHETKRQLGVYRALGYTVAQIRQMVVIKSTLMGIFSLFFGMILFAVAAGKIMDLMMISFGMANFPMQINVTGSFLVMPAVLLLCYASAWIPSNQVGKIQPRTLIVE